MQTVIITGLSGAGKSQAVDILEDFGFFCVDNLPPQALMTFIDLCEQSDIEKLALVIDVRAEAFKPNKDLKLLDLKKQRPELNILYLDADDDALIKRYQETRRRHPLLLTSGTLEDAIHDEREWLKPLREAGGAPSTRKSRSVTSTPASGTSIRAEPLPLPSTSVMLVAPAGVAMTTT